MRPTVRAIVNADDLGLSPEVNHAIFALMAERRVTSATILANAPCTEEAARRWKDFPGCSFGVHMNATQFEPLTRSPDLAPLLDERGAFAGSIREARFDRRLRAAIYEELAAQITRVRALGVPVSHLDSHHHVHTIPALFGVLAALKRRFAIRTVRITRNLFPLAHPYPPAHRLKKALWNFALRRYIGARTTDAMGDLASFLDHVREVRGGSTLELMVHPGNLDCREEERMLHTEWWTDLPFDLVPMSFHDL
jgi:chitin disaccharide deacetylase